MSEVELYMRITTFSALGGSGGSGVCVRGFCAPLCFSAPPHLYTVQVYRSARTSGDCAEPQRQVVTPRKYRSSSAHTPILVLRRGGCW